MAKIVKYISELPNGGYRYCNPEEIEVAKQTGRKVKRLLKRIEKAKQALRELTDNCKHEVCADEAGFPYDTRTCVVCGNVSLI